MFRNSYSRESNPSIDTLQFEVNPDTESSTESSTVSSSSSIEEELLATNVTDDNNGRAVTSNFKTSHDSIFIGGQFNSIEYLLKSLYSSLQSSD